VVTNRFPFCVIALLSGFMKYKLAAKLILLRRVVRPVAGRLGSYVPRWAPAPKIVATNLQ
jgi:hypothetical protein